MFEIYDQPWDFELLDTGDGYRLEKWGDIILARPDPQIIWPKSSPKLWEKIDAKFIAGKGEEKGRWDIRGKIPNTWNIKWHDINFLLKLSPFKHTGIFPEQAAQWEWMLKTLSPSPLPMGEGGVKALNLFAYTGGATMALAKEGCQVTHVDASKPAITWANENHKLNNLPKDSVRWILDDAVKFVKRELKRGAKYDGIIMDPPAFGHGPTGKTWKFNDNLPELLMDCVQLLSDDAKFLIINGYATNSSALALNNLLEDAIKNHSGKIESGELCLKHPIRTEISNGTRKNSRMISTGIFARWQKD